MKITIAACLAALFINLSHADDISITETISYSGSLAGMPVFMTLSERHGKFIGRYFYKKYKTPMGLHGSLSNNNIRMTEDTSSSRAIVTAELHDGQFQGTWRDNETIHNISAEALSETYKKYIKSISSSKTDDGHTLTISYKDDSSQSLTMEALTDSLSLIFEDHNFDGYPDLRVLEATAGANNSYIAWDFDPDTNKFQYSKILSELANIKVLHDEKAILSVTRESCCRYRGLKLTNSSQHLANYDYETNIGSERITDQITTESKTKPIGQTQFEEKYLLPMGTGGS